MSVCEGVVGLWEVEQTSVVCGTAQLKFQSQCFNWLGCSPTNPKPSPSPTKNKGQSQFFYAVILKEQDRQSHSWPGLDVAQYPMGKMGTPGVKLGLFCAILEGTDAVV